MVIKRDRCGICGGTRLVTATDNHGQKYRACLSGSHPTRIAASAASRSHLPSVSPLRSAAATHCSRIASLTLIETTRDKPASPSDGRPALDLRLRATLGRLAKERLHAAALHLVPRAEARRSGPAALVRLGRRKRFQDFARVRAAAGDDFVNRDVLHAIKVTPELPSVNNGITKIVQVHDSGALWVTTGQAWYRGCERCRVIDMSILNARSAVGK